LQRYQRDPDEARKKFENPLLNSLSKAAHERDVKNNAAPKPYRRREETQHPTSAAFERRINGR
jgi:hypothetical protein